jgi:hypothetical protein
MVHEKEFPRQARSGSTPPEKQIQGPSNANFTDYGKLIDNLGGADICYGGIGWSGHIAYIEPGSGTFAASSLEEGKKIGPRIVKLTPFSILQNCLGPEFGQSGDWSSPAVMIYTPWNDRSPSAACLSDGTMVAGFFTTTGGPNG